MKRVYAFLLTICFLNTLLFSQNVGIGTPAPTGKLQINSNAIDRPTLKLYDSVANNGYPVIQFLNAGGNKYWQLGGNLNEADPFASYFDIYNNASLSYLFTVRGNGNVGIGNASPTYKLDVNGDLNLTGTVRINGSTGLPGQVLTSNGSSDPQWKNAAYGNNTRFWVILYGNTSSSTGDARILFTKYNLNPSDITINVSSITINHSGLYHFDFFVTSFAIFTTAPTAYPRFGWLLDLGFDEFYLVFDRVMPSSNESYTDFRVDEKGSLELYITSGTTFSLRHSFSGIVPTYSVYGTLNGHLISD